jgi:hypothetical protein
MVLLWSSWGLLRHSLVDDARAGKKLELDELARARSSSARLDAQNKPVFVAHEKERASSARLGAARELARGSAQQQFVT